ncbi:MAG TPA: hypothetical protein VFW92_03285 [Candidatus Limnocylindrales bacterium]|nr:hypothetical protein [Candidatus Limnocylindrales bacterium]
MSAFPPADASRPTQARLARIHLRVGLVSLARAELETMAGLGELDGPAVADLAEARWRTGDLTGAGEAARAHLDGGGDDPVAFVVAAEADAARGRLADARALAARVTARDDVSAADLDRLLGGRARAPIWPEMPALGPAPAAGAASETPGTSGVESASDVRPAPEPPAVAEAAAAPETGETADPAVAASRLGLELRQHTASPADVLARADTLLGALPEIEREGAAGAAIQLVRGDAFRQLGREEEARAAYRACWSALERLPSVPDAPRPTASTLPPEEVP